MAWEEESIEGGADFEEMGGKKSPIKLILIVVVVLLVAAGGWFAYKKFMSKPDKPPEEAAVKEEPAAPTDEPGFPVQLEKFTLNLTSATGGSHVLVTKVTLEVSTLELQTALREADDKKLYMIKTRDTILSILRRRSYKDMSDPDITKEIAKEVQFKLNPIYKADGEVKNVYFSELMVQ